MPSLLLWVGATAEPAHETRQTLPIWLTSASWESVSSWLTKTGIAVLAGAALLLLLLGCDAWAFRCRMAVPAAALPFLLLATAAAPALGAAGGHPSAALLAVLLRLLVRESAPVVAAIMACLILLAGSVTAARFRTARRHRRQIVLHRGSSSMPVSSKSAAISSISDIFVTLAADEVSEAEAELFPALPLLLDRVILAPAADPVAGFPMMLVF